MSLFQSSQRPEGAQPPRLAQWILWAALSEADRDCVVGDLLEEWDTSVLPRVGEAAARRWFWRQALGSLGPMVWRRMVKAVSAAVLGRPELQVQPVSEGVGMFDECLLDSAPTARARRRKWWTVPVAVAAHLFIIATAAFSHIWRVGEVPEPVLQADYIPIAMRLPPPPPPPAGGKRPRPQVKKPPLVKVPKNVQIQQPSKVEALVESVEPAVQEPDEPIDFTAPEGPPDALGEPGGLPGGQPGGIPGGVQGGFVSEDTSLSDNDIIPVAGAVVAPKLLRKVEPRYTRMAIQAKIQGTVIVEAIIDRSGNVTNCRIIQGLGGGLNEEALRAVGQWKFQPATLNGRPVTVYFSVRVGFVLHSAGR